MMALVNNDLQVSAYLGNQLIGTLNTGINLNDNQWYHVAWVLSPSGVWAVYVDGMLAVTATSNAGYPTVLERVSNFLGKSNSPADPYFNGAIRDFRIYDRNLTSSEIALLFSSTEVSNLTLLAESFIIIYCMKLIC